MKSRLVRRLCLLRQRPYPERSTTHDWRPEDFQAVPEPLSVPDPWSDDASRPTPRDAGIDDIRAADRSEPKAIDPGFDPLRPAEVLSRAADGIAACWDDDGWDADAFAPVDEPGAESAAEFGARARADDSVADDTSTLPEALPPGFHLPEFDPTLRQTLGSEHSARFDPRVQRAKQKAASVAALLEVTTRRELRQAVTWLEAFFLQHDSPATYRAIEDAARQGLAFQTLRDMAALRDLWAEHPEWWQRRIPVRDTRLASGVLVRNAGGSDALSWARARRICEARADWPVEEMIDPDWFTEWCRLKPQNGSALCFLDFIEEKIALIGEAGIAEGLHARSHAGVLDEFCDRYDWVRRLRDPSDGGPLSPIMADVTATKPRVDGHGD